MITNPQFRINGRIGSINILDKVTHLSIATDRRGKDQNGNWETKTDWTSVTVLSPKLRKRLKDPAVSRHGNLIIIEGSIQSNAYKKDGKKVYDMNLVAQKFDVLSFARQSN